MGSVPNTSIKNFEAAELELHERTTLVSHVENAAILYAELRRSISHGSPSGLEFYFGDESREPDQGQWGVDRRVTFGKWPDSSFYTVSFNSYLWHKAPKGSNPEVTMTLPYFSDPLMPGIEQIRVPISLHDPIPLYRPLRSREWLQENAEIDPFGFYIIPFLPLSYDQVFHLNRVLEIMNEMMSIRAYETRDLTPRFTSFMELCVFRNLPEILKNSDLAVD